MDTGRRTWAKAFFWQLIGLLTSGGIGYLFTGSIAIGGTMAILNAAIGFAGYFLYERLWNKVNWGRIQPTGGRPNA